MTSDHIQSSDRLGGDEPISVSALFHVFKRYLGVILLGLAAIAVSYLIIAAAILLLAPRQRTTTLPFRLEFKGADRGEYPNGFKFSVADITATPVLLDVFSGNELSRFTTFDQFSRSLYVLEANRDLDRLSNEYQTKLADPKLTPIDRERIERDFESKRAAISKSDYALQFTTTPSVAKIPPVLVPKILDDTLRTWARRAAIEKKVLDYRVPALTANILSDIRVENGQYLVPLLLLRRRVDDVIKNVGKMFDIPGAELVRTKKEHKSLEEIRLTLDELIRFRLEPLIARARFGGLLGPSSDALRVLRAQLSYDERALTAARGREAALRNALATYESTQRPQALVTTSAAPLRSADSPNRETVMPQISDTFLERIVDLANRNADREYRQKLTEEIKEASLTAVPLEAAVKYDHELIDSFATPSTTTGASLEIEGLWKSLLADVHQAIEHVNEIYIAASRQLYPETELYRVLGPPVTRTQRSVSPARLALGGALTFLIALPLIMIIVLIHNRIREEDRLAALASQDHSADHRTLGDSSSP